MSETKNDNMAIWDKVCVTKHSNTKDANVRGNKITAICPQSQIMEATRLFGAYGHRWGFSDINISFDLFEATGIVNFCGMFYYPDGRFPISSSISAYRDGARTKPDADFAKKVETDALTKALSKLGFNADIFLGKYDDNKYVNDRIQDEKEPEPEPTEKVKFIQGVKAMMSDTAPKTGEDWQNYIKPLCDALGEKIVSIKDIEDDSKLWAKLSDQAVQEYTKDA